MTEPTGPGVPQGASPEDDTTVTPDVDDAINTESVNDGEEVAPEHTGATPPGTGTDAGGATASGPGVVPATIPDAGAPHPDSALAAERLADLQRLQAEYVNYKRRVDRDRALVQ